MDYSVIRELSQPESPHAVTLARDQAGNAIVLKRLRESYRDREDLAFRLELEARLLRELDGKHGVVRLVAVEERPLMLVIEYVSGGSLSDRLHDARVAGVTMPVSRALSVAAQVLDALAHAHAHDIVHRDVKPSNVLFANDGTIRLIDFGVAARADPARGGRFHGLGSDWIEERVGTLPYAPPESVLDPSGGATPAHDIYSAAVLVYELLTGTPPWSLTRNEDPASFAERVTREWHALGSRPIPGVESGAAQALVSALHPDPHRRTGSASAFAAELGAVMPRGELTAP